MEERHDECWAWVHPFVTKLLWLKVLVLVMVEASNRSMALLRLTRFWWHCASYLRLQGDFCHQLETRISTLVSVNAHVLTHSHVLTRTSQESCSLPISLHLNLHLNLLGLGAGRFFSGSSRPSCRSWGRCGPQPARPAPQPTTRPSYELQLLLTKVKKVSFSSFRSKIYLMIDDRTLLGAGHARPSGASRVTVLAVALLAGELSTERHDLVLVESLGCKLGALLEAWSLRLTWQMWK